MILQFSCYDLNLTFLQKNSQILKACLIWIYGDAFTAMLEIYVLPFFFPTISQPFPESLNHSTNVAGIVDKALWILAIPGLT